MSDNNKGKTTQQILEENLRNFKMNTSNALEKEKKILFGRTDIGINPGDIKHGTAHSEIYSTQWHDPEMTGPVEIFGIKIIEDTLGIVGENEFKVLTPEQEAAYERMRQITGDSWTKKDTRKAIENIEFVKPVLDGKMFDGEEFDAAKIEDELRFPRPASTQPIASGEPETGVYSKEESDALMAKWSDPEYYKKRYENTDNTIKWLDFAVENNKWITDIFNYCTEQGISPDQLIEDHKSRSLWEFWYCPNIHESTDATMSIHLTKGGAEKAMEKHKKELFEKWNQHSKEFKRDVKFASHEGWGVKEIKIEH